MSISTNRKYLNDREVEELTGIARSTLAKARCLGTLNLPFLRIGRSIRYSAQDVINFMNSHKVNPAAGKGATEVN